jgi:cytochrome oxidase Cu insertion factor (SCO1/SenC/PrrC family)
MSGSKSSSPAEPLALTVHDLAPPDLSDADAAARRRTTAGRLKMLAVLAVCAAPVIGSYLAYYVVRPEARSNYGTLIQPSRSLPELKLADLDGRPVTARSLHGQWLLLLVGPAGCDADCEQRLFMQRQLREMLGRDRERLDKVWLVTDDAPLRPELRAALGATPAATVLRADRAAVAAWLAPEPGKALEEHLYIVDPLGEWMMRMPVGADPAKVKRDLEKLLRASAGWDQPGR